MTASKRLPELIPGVLVRILIFSVFRIIKTEIGIVGIIPQIC